ncbi:hypothetical protein H6P81_009755 [Aristolochia fimbriata]|uniref:Uncharacterized protein n=1 Tax=Aristolochia fimbriata TaxID=158543 RepID=A0AAV7ELT6_ARIFI|nr:hypothetical protein H6P81_009755 [Aristolochia fimbriata]
MFYQNPIPDSPMLEGIILSSYVKRCGRVGLGGGVCNPRRGNSRPSGRHLEEATRSFRGASQPRFCSGKAGEERDVRSRKGIELEASEEHLSQGSALGRLVRREISDRGRVSAGASQPRLCFGKAGEERDVRPRKGIELEASEEHLSHGSALERLVRREMFDRGRVSIGFAPERKVKIAVGKRGVGY